MLVSLLWVVVLGLGFCLFFIKVTSNIEQVKYCKDMFCFGQMEGLKTVFEIMSTDGFAIITHMSKNK